jgi:hypothetical protein
MGNQAVIKFLGDHGVSGPPSSSIQRDYTDIPDEAAWLVDTKKTRTGRTDELESIDKALAAWEVVKAKAGTDTPTKLEALRNINNAIYNWNRAKGQKYGGSGKQSVRQDEVDDLKKIVDAKITFFSDLHALELQPLADEYVEAAKDHDIKNTRKLAAELSIAHNEFFLKVIAGALTAAKKAGDKVRWAILFFTAPQAAISTPSVNYMVLAGLGDYNWMTKKLADFIINDFITPNVGSGVNNAIMGMLQVRPFRLALQAKATPATWKELSDSMPLLRITAAAEQSINDDEIDDDDIDGMAEAVFHAFLGDLDKNNLLYATNSAGFQVDAFVLGTADPSLGAPCMMLSSVFNQLFKMVTSKPPQVTEGRDTRPMLTKPLASIGNKGILTRETTFVGNVSEYGKLKGYAAINRIFFGDGHVWLEVNGKEYDPTLGIMGPKGTVINQVETIFTSAGKDKYKGGGLTAKRNNKIPPGGKRLLFERSAVIT